MQLWQITFPVHATWQFTTLCSCIVVGLALSASDWSSIFALWLWTVTGIFLGLIAIIKQQQWMLVLSACGGLLIGLSCGAIDTSSRVIYEQLVGSTLTLTGTVSEDVDKGKHGELLLRLENVHDDSGSLPAMIWVTLGTEANVHRSDELTIQGKLSEGFGSFGASMYRAKVLSIQRPQPGDVALVVRDDFGDKVRRSVDEPAASLAMGYLAGQRRGLPEELDASLKTAGLTHIVVASGYNLTILVRAIKRFFEKRSRYATIFLSAVLIVGFIMITGLSPSMTRAGLVAGLALLAWYFGRTLHPVTLLAFAAAVTGLFDPSYVWGNVGWQLSFAAFGGVMIVAPLLQAYFFGEAKPSFIRQIVGETLSAQIVTAPLILYHFGTISNVALIANALILPLVPLAMILTFITGILNYTFPLFAVLVAVPLKWLLDYMIMVASTASGVSWAQTSLSLPLWGMILGFLVIITACWWMKRATRFHLRKVNIIE